MAADRPITGNRSTLRRWVVRRRFNPSWLTQNDARALVFRYRASSDRDYPDDRHHDVPADLLHHDYAEDDCWGRHQVGATRIIHGTVARSVADQSHHWRRQRR